MKISIVTPVYNEEKSLNSYFKVIRALDYSGSNFEVIMVDDGSRDGSLELLEKLGEGLVAESKINFRIIKLGKNRGRSMARIAGAKAAKYNNILFLDAKCEIFPDVLKVLKKLDYAPLNPVVLQKLDSVFDLFFHIVRRAFYRKNFGENFPEQFITAENFDSMAKGTTMFFCEKTLFLQSQPSNIESKNNSDDTALLANIVKKKPILATPLVRCYYNTRSSFIANVRHIFNRGPKFVDYYYKPSKIHFWLINLVLLGLFLLIYRMSLEQISFYGLLSAFLIMNVFLAFYVSRKLKEFFIFFLFFPIFSFVFFLGLTKGFILKLVGKRIS